MRKFRVLHCAQKRTVFDIKTRRDDNGNKISYKVYREEQAGENDWWPGAYGHEKIKEGDILELEGRIADKAAANPQFEEVFPKAEKPVEAKEPVVKKKRGRPRKKANAA